jgi:hypothetical protein
MSTEKRRGAVVNGDAANDVDLSPGQGESGADGGGAVKGSPTNILAGGVDQAAAYVPPTPPPRHARTKTLDMKRVRVASSADPRNAPTQKIMIPRPPTPPAGAGTPQPAAVVPVTEPVAPVVSEPVAAEPRAEEPAIEEPPVAERGAEVVDAERHRILQVLVVLLSAVAVLIVGAVVIILRMNRQPIVAPPPTPTAVITQAPPVVEPPVAPTLQPTVAVQPTATAEPDPTATADVAPTAPVVTTPPVVTPPVTTTAVGAGTGRLPKPTKPTKPDATSPSQPPPSSTFSPIFELP